MKLFAQTRPWYVAGLAFECVGCGRCCAGPEEGYVWVTPEEIVTIAEHLGLGEAETCRGYVRKVGRRFSLIEKVPSRDCIFLQADDGGGRRCRIYAVRPAQCRAWPFWPSNLADADSWASAGMRCKGINRGRTLSLDQIERIRRTTRG